jgi:CRISPR-associated protein Cas1
MLKKILSFSRAYHLSTRNGQLLFTDKEQQHTQQRPIEDIGCIVIEHPQITITAGLLQLLAAHNVAVLFCDEKHMPASMLYHFDTHYVQTERLRQQLAASEPLCKQLWQQTVKSKIINQAAVLELTTRLPQAIARLRKMTSSIRSGDPDNYEAQAAQHYWPALMGENFRRDPEGLPPNPGLNYGYAILRAAAARALAATGLLPAVGIHHRNRYNAFCLADDLMEPFRPWVDRTVWLMREQRADYHVLNPANKQELLGILYQDACFGNETSPLMVAISRCAHNLARAFAEGSKVRLQYPTLPGVSAKRSRMSNAGADDAENVA